MDSNLVLHQDAPRGLQDASNALLVAICQQYTQIMIAAQVAIQDGFPDVRVIIQCPAITPDIEALAARLLDDGVKIPGVTRGVTHLINRDEVLYFESVDKRSFIYTADAVYDTPLTLREVEERWGDAGFFRSSKSQIVNIAKIVSLCPDFGGRMDVFLINDEKLIISRHYAKQLKERLSLK